MMKGIHSDDRRLDGGRHLRVLLQAVGQSGTQTGPTEAPAGFDGLTNGFVDQTTHDADAETFAEQETVARWILGPVHNAQSCGECHQNPVTGQFEPDHRASTRAGRPSPSTALFVSHPGDSLIHSRATFRVDPGSASSPAIPSDRSGHRSASWATCGLWKRDRHQHARSPLPTISRVTRTARSGGRPSTCRSAKSRTPRESAASATKNQQASLASRFPGDAHLNEMGITTPMFPVENTSNGHVSSASGTACSTRCPNRKTTGRDLEVFARFMRATAGAAAGGLARQ